MTYLVDDKDILFNLFDYLKLQNLANSSKFTGQNLDLYKMVFTEAYKFIMKEVDPLHIPGDRAGCQFDKGKVSTPKGYKE
ncbi:MAG: Acyl-CoA dehydrogenase-like protein, partial [uncultured bacterium]